MNPAVNKTTPDAALPTQLIASSPTNIAHTTCVVYTNGVVSASGEVWSNLTATVVYTAESGYYFVSGLATSTHELDTTRNPAVNLTYPEEPVSSCSVAIDSDIVNGTVTASRSVAIPGATVALTLTPDSGYYYDSDNIVVCKTDDPSTTVSVTNNQFTMPGYPVTVTATFAAGVGYRYAVYNTDGDATSGIREWKMSGKATGAYTELTTQTSLGSAGADTWFAVTASQTISSRITCYGNVHLILCDGCTLTASAGISVRTSDSATLTIYGQKNDTGTLLAATSSQTANCAGIGGNSDNGQTYVDCGAIVVHGGNITAKGGTNAAGIGGGLYLKSSNAYSGNVTSMTVNGGSVTATGGSASSATYGAGAGIGGSGGYGGRRGTVAPGTASDITINGGKVTASGGSSSAHGIGKGEYSSDSYKGTDPSGITASASLLVKAGATTPPATTIDHASSDDLASNADFLKQYVTIEQVDFTVTVEDTENGTVTSDQALACVGTNVTLTVVPASGCLFAKIAVTKTIDRSVSVAVVQTGANTYAFTMPEYDVTVSATFAKPERIPSSPTPVDNATYQVFTNGVLSVDGTVWSYLEAYVVYTCADGYRFTYGTVLTNALDTTVNPAVNATVPETPFIPDELQLGNFNFCSMSFSYVTGTGDGLYRQLTIMLSRRMTDENVVLPDVEGFTLDEALSSDYSYVIDIDEPGKTAAEIAQYIRQIAFNGCRDQRVRFILDGAGASNRTFYFDGNWHYYQYVAVAPVTNGNYVSPGITWLEAYEAARQMTYMGRQGYLATIVSREEDMFVYEASAGRVGWLGGTCATHGEQDGLYYNNIDGGATSDSSVDHFYWACGPEIGQTFYDCVSGHSDSDYTRNRDTNGYYFNWDAYGGEPNHPDQGSSYGGYERFVTTLGFGSGYNTGSELPDMYGWNDLANSNKNLLSWAKYAPLGYLVEFGGQAKGDAKDGAYVQGYVTVEYDITAPVVTYDATEGVYASSGLTTNAVTLLTPENGYEFPSETPVRNGYKIKGWYADTNDLATAVQAGAPLLSSVDHTVYALWMVSDTTNVEVTVEGENTVNVNLPKEEIEKHGGAGHESDTEENGNRVWQNITMGLGGDLHIGTRARQDGHEERLRVIAHNLDTPPENTGFVTTYYLDRVTRQGKRSGGDEEVESTSSTPSGLEVDLTKVESNAFYKVRVRIAQTNEGSSVTLDFEATNTLGVLKVSAAPKMSIVAVPWGELGEGDADVKVADLVKTANLSPGDKLYIYSPDGAAYQTWTLDDDLAWQAADVYKVGDAGSSALESGAASEVSVPRGSGVWLSRQDASKPFYLYGQVETNTSVTTTLAAGETWNLIGSPRLTPVDLDEQFPEPKTGDRIIIPTGAAPLNYTFKDGKWGRYVTETVTNKAGATLGVRSVRKTGGTTGTPGLGFWYYKEDETARTINW